MVYKTIYFINEIDNLQSKQMSGKSCKIVKTVKNFKFRPPRSNIKKYQNSKNKNKNSGRISKSNRNNNNNSNNNNNNNYINNKRSNIKINKNNTKNNVGIIKKKVKNDIDKMKIDKNKCENKYKNKYIPFDEDDDYEIFESDMWEFDNFQDFMNAQNKLKKNEIDKLWYDDWNDYQLTKIFRNALRKKPKK